MWQKELLEFVSLHHCFSIRLKEGKHSAERFEIRWFSAKNTYSFLDGPLLIKEHIYCHYGELYGVVEEHYSLAEI